MGPLLQTQGLGALPSRRTVPVGQRPNQDTGNPIGSAGSSGAWGNFQPKAWGKKHSTWYQRDCGDRAGRQSSGQSSYMRQRGPKRAERRPASTGQLSVCSQSQAELWEKWRGWGPPPHTSFSNPTSVCWACCREPCTEKGSVVKTRC